ncbi:glycosyltransferase family 2 protein [Paramuribaculum intestinale]|uniref:glycosyltransferase family 2 protein n=1 Tax=Paramuribaculum intestinale TaxID=2094151 RepID=UPI0025B5E67C|nr:glycosyltransferase family A protein [Paramuribaculum intestinale]
MISVIIPAFNVEQYISECLDSILRQQYKDIEIIVINDGSTDCTLDILIEYSSKYSNIIIIDQENSGQSTARNKGIKEAKGEYIVFVDSDDWLPSDDILQKLINSISISACDYVQGGLCFVKKGIVTKRYIADKHLMLHDRDILTAAITLNGLYTAPFAKIYSTSFLRSNSLYFFEGLVNEDTAHSILLAAHAKKVGFLNEVIYCAREREASTSRADFKRMIKSMHLIMSETKDQLVKMDKFNDDIKNIFFARYLRSLLYNLLQSAQRTSFKSFQSDWKYCFSNTDYSAYSSYSKYLPLAHKLCFHLSKRPRLFFCTFRILNNLGLKMH